MHRFRFHRLPLLALPLVALSLSGAEPNLRTFLEQAVFTLASDAMEGRAAGSPGAERAAEYIEQRFREFGLKPAGDHGGYRQVFEIPTGVRLLDGNRLELRLDGVEHRLEVGKDYLPLSPSDSGAVEGPIVFAGYGIVAPEFDYDDYAGADVQDKVVLVLQGEPGTAEDKEFFSGDLVTFHGQVRAKLSAARAHGARAVLLSAGAIGDWSDHDLLPELKGGAAGGDAGLCTVQIKRAAAQQILAADGRSLETLQREIELKKAGRNFPIEGSTARLDVRLEKLRQPTANLVGLVAGRDPVLRDRAIVVGAHYDHLGYGGEHSLAPEQRAIHNGADDNASGTAGLLALARAFAQRPARHTLVFVAFSAEELGLLGASYQVEHPALPLADTLAMLNLDMIGRPSRNTLQVIGASSAAEFSELLQRLGAEHDGLKIAAHGVSKPGEEAQSQPSASALIGGSDQLSYLQKDVPALFLFAGQHQDYHRPSDDADAIEYDAMVRVVSYAEALLRSLDRRDQQLTFQRLPEAPNLGPGHRAWLGTVPDYGEMERPGVLLGGVRAGSPAELAGMRAGDILIKMDQVEIRNLYDFQYALNGRRPGDTVALVVERDGERLDLSATLGTRP
ncbi:MAG TPA: M20/M25/M40 family metallo-hydrolase [Acidobacteriota bacterium]